MSIQSNGRACSPASAPLRVAAAFIVALAAGAAAAQPAHAPGTASAPAHAVPQPSTPPPAPSSQPGAAAPLDTQGPIQHGPPLQRDRRHLRAGYWWLYLRGPNDGTVASGGAATERGVPAAPVAVRATHNYDGSVTIDWGMAAGASAPGDVYQVGRRLSGQGDFWLLGETTVPSYTDRTIPLRVGNAQYKVVVRRGGPEERGGVYGPVSAIATANLNHAWARTAQPSPPQTVAPRQPPPASAAPASTSVQKPGPSDKPPTRKTLAPRKEKP